MFSITVILEDTFAPPKIAKTGFSLVFNTLSILLIYLASKLPKHLFSEKYFATIVVEACAL